MPLTCENMMDYWGNSQVKCPFCDREFEPGHQDLNELYEEGEHTFDCPECEKEVTVHTAISHSFSTDKN